MIPPLLSHLHTLCQWLRDVCELDTLSQNALVPYAQESPAADNALNGAYTVGGNISNQSVFYSICF